MVLIARLADPGNTIVRCFAVGVWSVQMWGRVGNGVPVNRASVAKKGQNTFFFEHILDFWSVENFLWEV